MNVLYKSLLFSFITLFIMGGSLYGAAIEKKNILLLHSYHSGMTWVENINKAVYETLDPNRNEYVFHTEYMDTKRHNSAQYYASLKESYRNKYANTRFDLILSTDNNAFDFLLQNRNELFGNVPVIFSGVNGFENEMLDNVDNFTGVAEYFSAKETLELILKLHPNIKNIYVINDYLKTGLAWKKDMQKMLKEYENKVNIIYSENLTLVALEEKINSFQDDTAILMGVYFADKDNNYITYEKMGNYLLGKSKAPVYCLLNFNIANNVIGGKVISGYTQGQAMSQIALRVLNGEDPNTIAVVKAEANQFIFNYNGIKKYNINEALLPTNSTLINKPYSIYENYKFSFLALLAILVLSGLLFLLLLFYVQHQGKDSEIKRERLLLSFIKYSPIIFIPVATVAVILLFLYSTNQNYDEITNIQKQEYIKTMKQQSQMEVDRLVELIQIALQNQTPHTDIEALKSYFISLASSIRYEKSGYIIVGTMDGFMLAHPNKKLKGANIFDGNHEDAKNVFLKFQEIIKSQGKGFTAYYWRNPSTLLQEEKITYVRGIPELGWFIASGVYLDEIDKYLQNKIDQTALENKKNLYIIVSVSIIVLALSLVLSLIISRVLRNVFEQYKQSILQQVQKAEEIEASKRTYEILATTDSLTKVHNRFSIMNIFRYELTKAQTLQTLLSLIMFDLDHFKNVNDRYGHDRGDEVIVSVCKIVQSVLRDKDQIGRYGGEEFIVVLPDTDLARAKEVAQRVRKQVEHFDFEQVHTLTISVGVAEALPNEEEADLFKRLDTLLYRSKNEGRNRVSA